MLLKDKNAVIYGAGERSGVLMHHDPQFISTMSILSTDIYNPDLDAKHRVSQDFCIGTKLSPLGRFRYHTYDVGEEL